MRKLSLVTAARHTSANRECNRDENLTEWLTEYVVNPPHIVNTMFDTKDINVQVSMDTYSKLKQVQHEQLQATGKLRSLDTIIHSLVIDKLKVLSVPPPDSSSNTPQVMAKKSGAESKWPAEMR